MIKEFVRAEEGRDATYIGRRFHISGTKSVIFRCWLHTVIILHCTADQIGLH